MRVDPAQHHIINIAQLFSLIMHAVLMLAFSRTAMDLKLQLT